MAEELGERLQVWLPVEKADRASAEAMALSRKRKAASEKLS